MKSCTICEADISDDMRICEHCEEVIPVDISAVSDIEAEIDTVQVDISAVSDIEAEINTVRVDILASSDIEAGIDTVRVDSSEFSDMEASLEEEPVSPSIASDDINYGQEELEEHLEPIEELEKTVIKEEAEDTSSAMPVMYYDDVPDKGLHQRGFAAPTPLYSDSGVLVAQSERLLSIPAPDDDDEEGKDVPSTLIQPTLFYSGIQPFIQPTVEASSEKASLLANTLYPRLSMVRSLIVLLTCLIVITSSGISILLIRSHSHAMTLQITPAAQLKVKPGSLNFGQVIAGTKVMLAVVVANTGSRVMNWYVDTGNLAWLKVETSAGSIQPDGPEQFIYTTADTSQLKVGSYLGDEDIHSNGGNTRIPVQMEVVPSTGKKEAKLNIDQTGIDLGSVQPGQSVTSSVTVGNVGNQSLSWQASVGDTSWLSLNAAPSTGTIPSGGFPQTFNITANTTNLALGSYSAMLDIESNGGNAHIGIFLVISVSLVTVSPTLAPPTQHISAPPIHSTPVPPTQLPTLPPTQMPTLPPTSPPPPTWSVTPNSLDSTCLATGCVVTLAEDTASTGSMAWSASSDVGASFSPLNGTLAPGSSQQVIISGMTCNNGTFTFSGTGGVIPLTITWICGLTPTPTPLPTVIAPTAPPPTATPTTAVPTTAASPTMIPTTAAILP